MRRRLLVANLVIITALLVLLEVPLAIIYSRHEHDALNSGLQRDASSVAALAGEIIEHPGQHDVAGLARRFKTGRGAVVAVVGPDGTELTPTGFLTADPQFRKAIGAARAGRSSSGELNGLIYAVQPLRSFGDRRGAVFVARSDGSIDHRVRQFWLLLAALATAVLGISLAVSSRLGHWVVDPLRRLDEHAARLGSGALDTRADTTRGPPEVLALAATFNEMTDRLDALVKSQRRFVADASHQLRTPLTALRLRLENLDPENPAAVGSTRDAALDETMRLTRLVDGLLSLARAEGGRPERRPVDVCAALAERKEAWAPLAAEQGVELGVADDCPAALTAGLVPGHLEQILDNLIDNALDASRPGGTVEMRATAVGSSIEIHVVDEGRGMTDEERARAFDPFWRASDGRSNGNTGLGLAIADQLARSSRGSITLQRSRSGGIDATVRFPRVAETL
ncbi:MAG: sensor histidine kinase [Acidimicrobiales bacterium]